MMSAPTPPSFARGRVPICQSRNYECERGQAEAQVPRRAVVGEAAATAAAVL